jgi:hypothetical protein
VMVLGMQKKGGLVSSSSPFGLIAVAGRLWWRPFYQRERQKEELWMKNSKRNDDECCNVSWNNQSKMHVISMMPWQDGESGVWTM